MCLSDFKIVSEVVVDDEIQFNGIATMCMSVKDMLQMNSDKLVKIEPGYWPFRLVGNGVFDVYQEINTKNFIGIKHKKPSCIY